MSLTTTAAETRDAPRLTERFAGALRLASDLHGNDRRPGTQIPFMAHVLIVAGLVLEEGGDETAAVAAVLHDAVEECGDAALERIHDEFGSRIAGMVIETSENDGLQDSRPWRDRKRGHVRHMADIEDEGVLMILLADKLHNARSILRDYRREGDALWDRFPDRGADDQLWYFEELLGCFEERCSGALLDDFRLSVAEMADLMH